LEDVREQIAGVEELKADAREMEGLSPRSREANRRKTSSVKRCGAC
jgi:hypothetical protein